MASMLWLLRPLLLLLLASQLQFPSLAMKLKKERYSDDSITVAPVELTSQTIDAWLDNHPRALIDFYASWCGHCRSLAPQLDKAAVLLANTSPPIYVAKIDADEHKDIGKRYSIEGFPTLAVFRDSRPIKVYSGPHAAGPLASYVKRAFLPDLSILSSGDEGMAVKQFVQDAVTADATVPIFLSLGPFTEEEEESLSTIAAEFKDGALSAMVERPDSTLLSAWVQGGATPSKGRVVVSLLESEDERDYYTGPFDVPSLRLFLQSHMLPLLSQLTPENFGTFIANGRQLALVIVNGTSPVSRDFIALSRRVAPMHRNFSFAVFDAFRFLGLVEQFYGNKEDPPFPTLLVWDMGKTFFKPEDPSDFHGKGAESAIHAFMEDVKAGRVPPKLTAGPSVWEQLKAFVSWPQFPWFIGGAICIMLIMVVRESRLRDQVAQRIQEEKEAAEAEERDAEGDDKKKGRGRLRQKPKQEDAKASKKDN